MIMTTDERSLLQRRFDAKYIPEPNSGCWLWISGCHRGGYGTMTISKKAVEATHVSLFLKTGQWPPKGRQHYVCHTCDIPSCVNPDHLWIGTPRMNAYDAYNKGRRKAFGEHNGKAILTEAQVEIIRSTPKYRGRGRDLAEDFGVAQSTISVVLSQTNWKRRTA